ncbi:MAG: CBS domain-containing protein [Candidatus Magnetoovum sp. WYHC-5]|nr:CBS domain-containing protein [Candidatus Magnetoovum sp. WYHC-5]
MEIITCHTNADFDCLSSMVGISKIFKTAKLVFPGSQEKQVRDFLRAFPMDIVKLKDIELLDITKLIVVDTNDPQRIGIFKDIVNNRSVQVFVYDHHPKSKNGIKAAVEVIDEVGAATTLIVELIRERNISLTPFEATLLCIGIYEETGSMKFPTTTERDLVAASYLLRKGADLNVVSTYIQPELSKEGLALLNDLVSSLTEVFIHSVWIKIAMVYREKFNGEIAYFAHYIMDMEDIDALVLILNIGGKVFLVGRSRTSSLNIAKLMERFTGGGHEKAAAASIKEMPLDIVKENVIKALQELIQPIRTAKDIMTSPVITIAWDNSIKEAEKLLTKYEINVLPVIKNNEYMGLISREIVEKALFHGFKLNKVMEFTTTDAYTALWDTPIRTIEKDMIENNQRFVAIIDNKMPIGAITRTDLLRNLYEDYIKKSRLDIPTAYKQSHDRNIGALLRERLPAYALNLLITAGAAADELSMQAYLVGGSVRDILRGQLTLDIDIVVEGDGIKLAKYLSNILGGKMKTHERFQTAKIMDIPIPGNNHNKTMHIDVATARTEYYERPAELPRVETSSIKKDLYRRDFTINALAAKLNKNGFGHLIDFFGGQRDLKDGIIRVMHNLSFIEDPTRAFRAVRFGERFSFKLSKHTENLIISALKLDLFDKLSGARLFDELTLIFYEHEPEKIIKRLSRYGLLSVIHPKLSYSPRLDWLMKNVRDTLSWYNLLFLGKTIKKENVYLMALLDFLNENDRASALDRLLVPESFKFEIMSNTLHARQANNTLEYSKNDAAIIYKTLRGIKIEALLFLMSICNDEDKKKPISKYLIEHRNIKPMLTGKELIAMGIKPGPIYSQIFENILYEKLRGNINTKSDEIEYVKTHYSALLLI